MEFADNNKNLIINYLNSVFCLNNISHANLIISPDSFYNQFVAKTFSEIILCKNKNLCGICKPCLMNKSETNPDLVKYPRQTIFNTLDVTDIINNSLESGFLNIDSKTLSTFSIDTISSNCSNENASLAIEFSNTDEFICPSKATFIYRILPLSSIAPRWTSRAI